MKSKTLFLPHLPFCILMDVLGAITYAFPLLGEYADIAWAPFSAFIFYKMFGGKVGMIGAALNFIEEVVPLTDLIPSFTIAWFIRKREIENSNFNSIQK